MRKITLQYVSIVGQPGTISSPAQRVYEVMEDGSLEQVQLEILIDKVEYGEQ